MIARLRQILATRKDWQKIFLLYYEYGFDGEECAQMLDLTWGAFRERARIMHDTLIMGISVREHARSELQSRDDGTNCRIGRIR